MSEHAPEHEELLAVLLAGERTAEDPEVAARLRACPHCRERWDRLREAAAQVEQVGSERRALLAELQHVGPAAGEERVLATLQGLAGERAPAGRRPRRAFAWLAAAALLVVSGWIARALLVGREEPVTLGPTSFEDMAPRGAAASFERFSWRYTGPEAESFALHIYAETDGPLGDALIDTLLKETTWTPGAAEREKLPARIRWKVDAFDALNGPVGSSPWVEASR